MRRALCLVVLAISSFASADLTQIDVDNAYFSGTIMCFPLPNPTSVTSGEGGSGLNLVPVTYALTRKPNSLQTAGFTTNVVIEQTKTYTIVTNKFFPITPRTIVDLSANKPSKVANSDSGTNGIDNDTDGRFFRTFNSSPYNTDDYRFGKFRFYVNISVNGGAYSTIYSQDFIISPLGIRDANSGGGSPYGTGSGLTKDDMEDVINNQPINTGGFWEDVFSTLFIPNEETLETFRDTLAQWGTWGPFGIINYLNTRMDEYSESEELDYSFNVNVPVAGVVTFDLSPYETFIKLGRVIMAMGLWLMVVFNLWNKVYTKV